MCNPDDHVHELMELRRRDHVEATEERRDRLDRDDGLLKL